ncbi:hypothetical protein Tco_0794277 [Tanacetum coccineum]
MEATRRGKQTEFQKGFQKQAQVGPETRQVLTPYKDPERNFRFRKRKIQGSTTNVTDECMQLRKQIDEMIKAVSSTKTTISFQPSGGDDGRNGGILIIEAEIGGHFVHRMYVDRGASAEILYELCFIRLQPEIRSQMVPPTTYLTGFSGETIWLLGQISLLVKIGDEGHSTFAWMNFMVVRSPSQHNGIIRQQGCGFKENPLPYLPRQMDMLSSLTSLPESQGGFMTGFLRKLVETSLEYLGGMPTCQAKEKRASTGKKQSNLRRSGKTSGCRDHERSSLPQLAI